MAERYELGEHRITVDDKLYSFGATDMKILVDGSELDIHSLRGGAKGIVEVSETRIQQLQKLLDEEIKKNELLVETLNTRYIPVPEGFVKDEHVGDVEIHCTGRQTVIIQGEDCVLLPRGWMVCSIAVEPEVEAPKSSTPDWSTAPEWAQFWSFDANGSAFWYREEPYLAGYDHWKVSGSNYQIDKNVPVEGDSWMFSLAVKPT